MTTRWSNLLEDWGLTSLCQAIRTGVILFKGVSLFSTFIGFQQTGFLAVLA